MTTPTNGLVTNGSAYRRRKTREMRMRAERLLPFPLRMMPHLYLQRVQKKQIVHRHPPAQTTNLYPP